MSDRPVFHPWVKSTESPETYTRTLTTPEFVLAMLNEHAQGHNCPYLGATISIKNDGSKALDASSLKTRLEKAFIATRWKHPTVACQVKESKELVYKVEDQVAVAKWAERTVQTVSTSGGWLRKHEELSREAVLPTENGDCALLYLVLDPEQTASSGVVKFDLLLHIHHALVDGAGLRSIMNEVLVNLATSGEEASFAWGEEELRLAPAALDAAIISDEVTKQLEQIPKEIQLPPLPEPVKARSGTGVVAHTFTTPDFLNKLKASARSHDVRLTATVQAALVSIIYDAVKPAEAQSTTVISGFDLRAANLEAPWNERNRYVGAAVGLEMMQVSGSVLAAHQATGDFWAVAQEIQKHWAGVAQRKDVAAAGELRRQATGFILKMALDEVNKAPSGLGLALNYVSDPAGDNQLDGSYKDGQGTTFSLDQYQLITDESTPKLSCRSHSWNDRLTLEISFSFKHHSKEAVQAILEKWTQSLEALV